MSTETLQMSCSQGVDLKFEYLQNNIYFTHPCSNPFCPIGTKYLLADKIKFLHVIMFIRLINYLYPISKTYGTHAVILISILQHVLRSVKITTPYLFFVLD